MEKKKLSTAIREGAKLRPQGIGEYFIQNQDGEVCSCALGAAFEYICKPESIGTLTALEISDALVETYPFMAENNFICCPDENCDYSFLDNTLNGLIAHYNDNHQFTRHQIADYVESLGY